MTLPETNVSALPVYALMRWRERSAGIASGA